MNTVSSPFDETAAAGGRAFAPAGGARLDPGRGLVIAARGVLEEQHGQRRRPNDAERLRQAREAAVIAAADLEPGHSAAELARVLGVGERTVKRRRRLARAAVRAVLEGS